jgi:hypothetical protein
MEIRGGGDIWRIVGLCPEHPKSNEQGEVCPSSPVAFDEETMIMTTYSGSKYKLVSFISKENFLEQLREDVKRIGYEVH